MFFWMDLSQIYKVGEVHGPYLSYQISSKSDQKLTKLFRVKGADHMAAIVYRVRQHVLTRVYTLWLNL